MEECTAEFVRVAEDAARCAGDVLLHWLERKSVREKGPKDLVTEADLEAQSVIRSILLKSFPEHGFQGEEGDSIPGENGWEWVVDPLDGTANYVHQLPGFAVSIALRQKHRRVVGVVYDPWARECFIASAGHGARRNGTRIRPSSCGTLSSALVAASFSPVVRRGSLEIERFIEVLEESQSVRRLGSAALNLCYVAMGRLDAYWTTSVKSWDVAAGALILEEAGGIITNLRGEPLDLDQPELIAASQTSTHQELMSVIQRVDARFDSRSVRRPQSDGDAEAKL
ncbi:MAG: inositol monophosphatase [Planctomycetes bacterium]|nr:inositol monophosphatase [Planctomycetota bacterium]